MAGTKQAPSGSVSHKVNADGSHSIGVEVDGVFVPFASLDGAYVASRVEAGKSPEAQAAADADDGKETE